MNTLIATEAVEAITQVSGNKCVALVLERASEDISYEDLAEKHGIAPGTVKSRVFRGREAILKAIGEAPA